MDTAECEICGITRPVEELDIGWSVVCDDDPLCLSPYLYTPKQREVATLTVELLDALEYAADVAGRAYTDAEVTGPVLHALVAAARVVLAVDATPDLAAPLAVADLPDWWDARRARMGKPDKSTCAEELRAALLIAAEVAKKRHP